MNAASYLLVLKYTLGTIAERNDSYAITAYGHLCGNVVHLGITDIGGYITVCPGIKDARTVNAEEDAKAGCGCRFSLQRHTVIDMGEGIDTTFRVIAHLSQDTIHHPTRSCGSSNLARIHHVEGQGVVRLIATAIGNRCACL